MSDWQQELKKECRLNDGQISQLEKLLDLVAVEKNSKLTAVSGTRNIVRVHFNDSLWLLRLPELAEATAVADIGSGAGFPGLPLAIARPQSRFVLIEANRRKSDFVSRSASALGLDNVRVLPARAEEAARSDLRESFDATLARAVGSLPEVLEYSIPLLRLGGYALLQRGAREPGDDAAAKTAGKALGGELVRVETAKPYPEAKNLHVWIFKKTADTPSAYPRRPGIPRKRPLSG
ncbi:MAG: 16S rRNA (guanine(527)-N(7))-methyltransferase RsmG [Thermoleophilia bacterium]|nr:16S rRNA (guanine(527)-N(7))-methyltransferase RsmG [Thermoleophilia bacterium]